MEGGVANITVMEIEEAIISVAEIFGMRIVAVSQMAIGLVTIVFVIVGRVRTVSTVGERDGPQIILVGETVGGIAMVQIIGIPNVAVNVRSLGVVIIGLGFVNVINMAVAVVVDKIFGEESGWHVAIRPFVDSQVKENDVSVVEIITLLVA